MGYRYTEQIIFPLKSISARRFLHRFSAKPAWAANPLVDQITSMLKAAFELSQYSSQGQRLNYPLQSVWELSAVLPTKGLFAWAWLKRKENSGFLGGSISECWIRGGLAHILGYEAPQWGFLLSPVQGCPWAAPSHSLGQAQQGHF